MLRIFQNLVYLISQKITKRGIITFAASLSMVMSSVESSITATVTPYIINDLGGLNYYRWITSIYLLANTISMPLFGRLADNIGRKKIYLISLALFLGGSILCGLSVNMEILIISRIIQGIGAGGLLVLSTTILSDLYTAFERAKIQALLSALWNAAGAAGPFIGGIIIHDLSWRYAFFINIPICFIGGILICKNLSNDYFNYNKSIDKIGFLLFALSSTAILVSVEGTISVIGLLISLFLFSIFVKYEQKVHDQIIPFSVIKQPFVLYPCIASCFSRASSFSIIAYLPLLLVLSSKINPIKVGLILTPIIIGSFIGNFIAGQLTRCFTLRALGIFMQIIYLITTIICCALVITNIISEILYITLLFLGISLGGATIIGMLVMQTDLKPQDRGVGTSTLAFSRSMGGALGVGLLGAFISGHSNIDIHNLSQNIDLINSVQKIFFFIPFIAFIGILASTKYTNLKVHKENINNNSI